MNKRKIYVVGPAIDYANWMEGELVKNLEDADLVVFTGGEDVDPSLYNEPKHPTTGSNLNRDNYEQKMFKKAKFLRKHLIGICRGSQFLCVMAGGKLVQHQQNLSHMHDIELYDGKFLPITSTHHQAQYPWGMTEGKDFEVLGWSKRESDYHLDGKGKELSIASEKECEIVYYPKIKALGIQGHPEWMDDGETIDYLRNMLDKHMKNILMPKKVKV